MAFNPQNLSDKFSRFMSHRNGPDQLSRDMFVVAIVLIVLSLFFGDAVRSVLMTLGLAAIVYSYFRMFSSKVYDRSRENTAYLEKRHALAVKLHLDNVKNPFAGFGANARNAAQQASQQAAREAQKRAARKQDTTHTYLRCPKCKKDIRVPKGAGKIRITCPGCGEKFEKKV